MTAAYRIGVDVGGTFTDMVAIEEETGEPLFIKTPTTPGDPSVGVLQAVGELVSRKPGGVTMIVHASTVGTNLFLGQLGLDMPAGALITTRGFRDVLEIGRQRRPELYNAFFRRPKPLIPRELRFTVDERINFRGEIVRGLDEAEVHALASELRSRDVEAVAIALLHSYANPRHEEQVRDILRQDLPGAAIVASHEVDPAYREYERTSTTVINSLLIPVVSRYLGRLAEGLLSQGIGAPLYIMQSNGGLATVDVASRLPVATIESGPATGVTAAAEWGQMTGTDRILSFDMGGTTAKAGIVIDGTPRTINECEIGGSVHGGRTVKGSGYPVRYPFVDLAEVSCGGGTIAWIDEADALMVGPVSAGADPGPACYGRGGESPTITDANLVLGRLGRGALSGGAVRLHADTAEVAIDARIARPLGISVIEAAHGILEIVNTHMMRALRLVSIERGHDPRDFTMVAFGGAGSMHAALLAEGMGIGRVLIPPASGVFSAYGLLMADFRHDFAASVMAESSKVADRDLAEVFERLEREAVAMLEGEGFGPDAMVLERALEMRYVGQSYELTVDMREGKEHTVKQFHDRHRDVYGYASEDEPTEIVTARLTARGMTPKHRLSAMPSEGERPPRQALLENRDVFFAPQGWRETMVYARDALRPGNQITGPAIIEQYDATTVLPPGWRATVGELLDLRLEREAG